MPKIKGLTNCDGPLPTYLPPHHAAYDETTETIIAELHAVVDITLVPTYTDLIELSHRSYSDMLGYDNDGGDFHPTVEGDRMVPSTLGTKSQ